jgi:hypothetical protein
VFEVPNGAFLEQVRIQAKALLLNPKYRSIVTNDPFAVILVAGGEFQHQIRITAVPASGNTPDNTSRVGPSSFKKYKFSKMLNFI